VTPRDRRISSQLVRGRSLSGVPLRSAGSPCQIGLPPSFVRTSVALSSGRVLALY
jgi:hypothetical protein